MTRGARICLAVALLAVAAPAGARRTGAVDRSGKDGSYCTDCHANGSGNVPTVEFSGPVSVVAGAKNRYSFTVTKHASASHSAAGFNVAADDGTFATVTANTQKTDAVNGFAADADELTHSSARKFTDGAAIFEFDWTAPKKSGTFTLYGAGNAVNENGNNSGDDPAKTSYDIEVTCPDADEDGYVDSKACPDEELLDCDDKDADVNPGVEEICDGVDNDCNGKIDDGLNPDADNDGYSPPAPESTCPTGDKPLTDCDDTTASIRPGRVETCDGIDNNCDEMLLEGEHDDDEDGFFACNGVKGGDCNDSDGTIFPGAIDQCGDGIDQDCKNGDPTCECPDADRDGYKDDACGGDDCDDGDAAINPDATEQCDDVDHDCDGNPHNGLSFDLDEDGHYRLGSCDEPADDCDDTSNAVYPGATEVCGDEVDQDCNGSDLICPACMPEETESCYEGAPATKNVGVCRPGTRSCVDGDWGSCEDQILPGTETCENALDDDCDGDVDEGCSTGEGGSGGTGGSGGSGGTGGSNFPPRSSGGDDDGGGCNASGGGPALALLLAAALLLVRRRR